MRDFREIIINQGVMAARQQARTATERVSVDAALAVMEEPRTDIFYASRFITTLPHKGGKRLRKWSRPLEDDGACFWEGGTFMGEPLGVPFSAKSRIILLHLLNQAIITQDACVSVGGSMYEWARMISSRSLGGRTYSLISEHSRRIAACRLAIADNADPIDAENAPQTLPLIEQVKFERREPTVVARKCEPNAHNWNTVFPRKVVLNSALLPQLMQNPIVLRASALEQLSNNSAAIDLYIRLAGRLPQMTAPAMADWPTLAEKFAPSYKSQRQMKPAIHDLLQLVCAVYPEARIEFRPDGVLMRPSPPPIEDDNFLGHEPHSKAS